MKLTVIIPIYNERKWLKTIVEKVLRQEVPGIDQRQIILVDDASSDGTKEVVQSLCQAHKDIIYPIYHKENQGKGAAIRSALTKVQGDICVIQDADLEYDPRNYQILLEPIISGVADCVYGSRFAGSSSKRVLFFWHYMGNQFLTFFNNMFTNLNLTDMETGYKAFRSDILKSIPLRSNRFGFEPEITAKIAKRKCRIYEVGISYFGRTYAEGKKIGWIDGFKAVLTILKYWIINDSLKKDMQKSD